MTARVVPDDPAGRAEAIDALKRGRLVAMPTDTVYGLGVALDAHGGLERLFAAKRRPLDKGIVLLLADHRQAEEVGELDAAAHVLAAAFWPGGLTIVVPQRPDAALPSELTGGARTIGLRLPAHDAPRSLAASAGPLPVSSANRSGGEPAVDADGVLAQLGDVADLAIVLDGGPAPGGVASTVVECTGGPPRVLRPGAIPLDALARSSTRPASPTTSTPDPGVGCRLCRTGSARTGPARAGWPAAVRSRAGLGRCGTMSDGRRVPLPRPPGRAPATTRPQPSRPRPDRPGSAADRGTR